MSGGLSSVVLVAVGGAVGALLRYGLASATERMIGDDLPGGTLLVNVAGCAALGVIAGLVHGRGELSEPVRLLVIVGILGSLTTFSTFAGDTWSLFREARVLLAAGNMAANLVVGFGALALGWWVARLLSAS